jgi:archaellum component FlaG (FlaF/FlaG flagellin family)
MRTVHISEVLQMYIQNTERYILNRYSKALSVSNDDVVVIIDGEVIA